MMQAEARRRRNDAYFEDVPRSKLERQMAQVSMVSPSRRTSLPTILRCQGAERGAKEAEGGGTQKGHFHTFSETGDRRYLLVFIRNGPAVACQALCEVFPRKLTVRRGRPGVRRGTQAAERLLLPRGRERAVDRATGRTETRKGGFNFEKCFRLAETPFNPSVLNPLM